MLLALGLFNPVGGLLIGASMLTAIAKVHWPKVWASENGLEHPLLVLAVCAAIGVAGPGALSLDHVFGTALPTTATLVALVATLVGWATAMAFTMRHPVTGHAGAHAH
jgi:putative oxidoreductase